VNTRKESVSVIVVSYSDAGPARYYLWDRGKKKETFLFSNRTALVRGRSSDSWCPRACSWRASRAAARHLGPTR